MGDACLEYFKAMKTIILMRHAQAEPGAGQVKDFDRPLTSKGRKDAEKIAQYIQNNFGKPGMIYSSPAVRTMATAGFLHKLTGTPLKPVDDFYHADASLFTEFIHALDESIETVVITGHNPTISALASLIGNESYEMKPSDIIAIRLKSLKWKDKLEVTGCFHKSVY
jgi:phosphohistidine phosphatase